MTKEVCAFCGYGQMVQEYCGKLQCHKQVLSAHHKCMQYSSGLTQYTFHQFGGFHAAEVQKEIKRGRKLVCSWCKKVRTLHGERTSATAGCVLNTCQKTFHFLCAKRFAITSRRRLKTKKGKEVDLYYVFCSREHKKIHQQSARGIWVKPNVVDTAVQTESSFSCYCQCSLHEPPLASSSPVHNQLDCTSSPVHVDDDDTIEYGCDSDIGSDLDFDPQSESHATEDSVRLFLAVMHYNENCERGYLQEEDGSVKTAIYFPKAKKGEYSIRRLKSDPTYGKQEYSCSETDEEFKGATSSQSKAPLTDSGSSDEDKDSIKIESDNSSKESDVEEDETVGITGVCKKSVKMEPMDEKAVRDSMDCFVVLSSLESTASGALSQGRSGKSLSRKKVKVKREPNENQCWRPSAKTMVSKNSSESSLENFKVDIKREQEAEKNSGGETSVREKMAKNRRAKNKRSKLMQNNDKVGSAEGSKRKSLSASQTEQGGKRRQTRLQPMRAGVSSRTTCSSDSSDFDSSFPVCSQLNKTSGKKTKKKLPHYRRSRSPLMSAADLKEFSDVKVPLQYPDISKDERLSPTEVGASFSGAPLPSDESTEQSRSPRGTSPDICSVDESSDLEETDLPVLACKSTKSVVKDVAALEDSKQEIAEEKFSHGHSSQDKGSLLLQEGHDHPSVDGENSIDTAGCSSEWLRAWKRKHEDVTMTMTGTQCFQKLAAEDLKAVLPTVNDEAQIINVESHQDPFHHSSVDSHGKLADSDHHLHEESAAAEQKGCLWTDYDEQEKDHIIWKSDPATGGTRRWSSSTGDIKTVGGDADLTTTETQSRGPEKEAIGGNKERKKSGDAHISHNSPVPEHDTECVLVIPADARRFEHVAFNVQHKVAEDLGIEEKHIYFWTAITGVILPASCMLYYFKDLVNALQNEDWKWLRQLLTDVETLKTKHEAEYSSRMRHHKNLPSSEQKAQEVALLVESIVEGLNTVCVKNGTPMGMFDTSLGVNYLLLILNHISDQERFLKKTLGHCSAMYQWKKREDTAFSFENWTARHLQGCRFQESTVLRRWFTTHFHQVSRVIVLPEEELLLSHDPACSTDSYCYAQLKSRMDECKVSAVQANESDLPVIVFIRRIDSDIVCFERYLQACLKKYCRDFEKSCLTCVFHFDNLRLKNCPQISLGRNDCFVKFYSAFCPSEKPVSLVIVEVERRST